MRRYNTGDVKFNFIRMTGHEDDRSGVIGRLREGSTEGFIIRNALSQKEVAHALDTLRGIPADRLMQTRTGAVFPHPFATITDRSDSLRHYVSRQQELHTYGWGGLFGRIGEILSGIGKPFEVRVPRTILDGSPAVPATYRIYEPGMGGLYVHCGQLFQTQSPIYFQAVEPMVQNLQLSFFFVLQQPEAGGELTLYDMIWENVNGKEKDDSNDHVIDVDGRRIDLKDVTSHMFSPAPGDLLIFNGGRIWHRVEDIHGTRPRITLGGFLNFSPDGTVCYYWS